MRFSLAVLLLALMNAPISISANETSTPTVAAAAKPFIGRYDLSGVDSGAELLLQADGRYKWAMVAGSADLFSNGHWNRLGNQIILTADVPDGKGQLFALQSIEPWDLTAEQSLEDARYYAEEAEVYKRCPFLLLEDGTPGYYGSAGGPYPENDAQAALFKENARREVTESRIAYQKAAEIAVADTKTTQASADAARKARLRWYAAIDALDQRLNGNESIDPYYEIKLPEECDMPSSVRNVSDDEPAQWQRGFAVTVYDPEMGQSYSGVDVAFHYSDGTQHVSTGRGSGFSWAPLRSDVTINRVDLTIKFGTEVKTESFDIAPTHEGLLPVSFRSSAIRLSAFETMTLNIVGKNLIESQGGDRYRRAKK